MKRFFLALSLLLVTPVSWGEVYKWVDANGKIYFSDKKPHSTSAEQLKLKINTYTNVTFDRSIYDTDPGSKVVMYSTDWCGYCKKARKYFRKNNIPFKEYDIEKNSEAVKRYKKMGATGVPVILVGSKRMNGFSEQGFDRIYRK